MRDGRRIVDTDCHQMEPAAMWADYIDEGFKDAAPGIREVDGRKLMLVEGESFVCEGK